MSKSFTLNLIIAFLFLGSWGQAQSIWPGDVNNNGVVNCMDVLYWGVAYGKNGVARADTGTTWRAYPTPNNWGWSFPVNSGGNGMNYAYADANGDGVVDKKDVTNAIEANFTKKHGTVTPDTTSKILNSSSISLKLTASDDEPYSGSWITVELELKGNMPDNFIAHGIAFTIGYNANLIRSNSFSYQKINNSDVTALNSFGFGKISGTDGIIEIATVMLNSEAASLNKAGKFGKFTFRVRNTGSIPRELVFNIKEVALVDKNLVLIPIKVESTSLYVYPNDDDEDDDDDDDDDDNNCNLGVSLTPTDANCGDDNGSFSVHTTGGNPAYKISWSGPESGSQSTQSNNTTIDGLVAGNYSVTVTDKDDCKVVKQVKIESKGNLQIQSTITNASCSATGNIKVIISNGTAPYKVFLTGDATNNYTLQQSTFTLEGFQTGDYHLRIVDANGCSISKEIKILQNGRNFSFTATPTAAACESLGSITINTKNGAAPYQVHITGPKSGTVTVQSGTSFVIKQLPGGTYTVKVTEASGCSFTTTVTVPTTGELAATVSAIAGSCDQPGAIKINVASGKPNFIIEWDGPGNNDGNITTSNTASNISNLPAGEYIVKITDGNWCSIQKKVTVTGATSNLDLVLVPKRGICETPGSVGVDIVGGKAPFKVIWDGPGNNDGSKTTSDVWFEVSSLPAGSYLFTLTDANNCSIKKTVTLQSPESNLSLKLTVSEGACGQNGSIWADVDGGTPQYKVVWEGPTNGSGTSNSDKFEIKNLIPGTYTVKVTDGNWCVVSKTIVVTGGAPDFSLDLIPKRGICETPGSIGVDINGGKAPYKVTWDGPGNNDGNLNTSNTWVDLSNLPAGSYVVTVKDGNNCVVTKSVQLLSPEGNISASFSLTAGNCGQFGSIWIDVDGGTAPYKITWDGPGSSDGNQMVNTDKYQITNVVPGNYTIQIVDKNWCSFSKTISVSGGTPELDAQLTAVDGICETPGSIKVKVTGGKAPFKVTVDGPGNNDGTATVNGSNFEINNLPPGNYIVKITDTNGCSVTKNTHVAAPEGVLTLKLNVTEGHCGASSKILVDVDGGSPVYKISWEGPGNNDGEVNTNNDKFEIKDLAPGTYTIKVFDKNWCSVTKTIVVNGGSPGFDFKLTPTNGICETPGLIKVTIDGGKAPYKITWDGPGSNDGTGTTNGSLYEIGSLPTGTYTVTIKDGNNCSITKTTQISNTENTLTLILGVTEGFCGAPNKIWLDIDGGAPAYKIIWEGPGNNDGEANTNSDKFEIKDLPTGHYTIKVFDRNWCYVAGTIQINEGSPNFDTKLTPTPGLCESPGSIKVTMEGGKAPYKITWNGPGSNDGNTTTSNSSHTINNLPAGAYTIIVKDANDCVVEKTTQVSTGENNVSFTTTIKDATCVLGGSVKLDISGGSAPFKISWDGPGNNDGESSVNSTIVEIKNLIPGSYTFKVVDKNWCTFSRTVQVGGNTTGVDIQLTALNGVCETPGSIKVKILTGKAPFKITWNGPGSNDGNATTSNSSYDINNLPAGTYAVTVKDANDCEITKSTQVSTPEGNLQLSLNAINGACGAKGSIKVNVSGGTPNYIIEWDGTVDGSATTGSSTYTIPNLPAGSYTIKVTDGNWCTTSKTIAVANTPAMLFAATPSHGTCDAPGSIKLNLTSGTAPYNISWTGSNIPVMTTGSSYTINNLTAGAYTINVTDKEGCTDSKTVTINTGQSNLQVVASVNEGNCGETSKAWVNISGGTAKYKIVWEGPKNGSAEVNINSYELPLLPSGKYNVTVTDANGCKASTMFTIIQTSSDLFKTKAFNGVCETFGSIRLSLIGGMPVYQVSWEGPTRGAGSTSDTAFVLQNLAPGTYTIKVTDKKGCSETETVVLGLNESQIDFKATVQGACGNNNSVRIKINSGMPTYTIQWDGPGNQDGSGTSNDDLFTIPNLAPGTYKIVVLDKNWCHGDTTITINGSSADVFTATVIPGTCGPAGAISLEFNTTPNYQIKLNGPVDSTITVREDAYLIGNLPDGVYALTVTDGNGCSEKQTLEISGGTGLVADIDGTNGNCETEGKITVNIVSGEGPFKIVYKLGEESDTIDVSEPGELVIADIPAGNYRVTVFANNGCSIAEDVIITITESVLEFTTTLTNVTCSATGKVQLAITGGNAPYNVSWSGEGISQSATTSDPAYTITGLPAGTFTITVKDRLTCASVKTAKIVAAESNLDVAATVTNGACGESGKVLVSATGGTAPFIFKWSGNANGSQTTNDPSYTISNLNSGTYQVTVTDGGGCSKTRSVNVTNTNQLPTANFTFTVNGLGVTFVNQSSAGSYQWNFADQSSSTQSNPTHTYGSTGTFNVCLKVTNDCGVKEICKEVTLQAPNGVVNIDVEDGSGGIGETIYIPVVVKNCVTNTLVSFAGSLEIENANVAEITGILQGSIMPFYSAANKTFSYYANNGTGIPCGNGQILFYVGVKLKGTSGSSTTLKIVNNPVPIEVGGISGGIPTSVPHLITGGVITVQSSASLQGEILTYWGDALPTVEVNITSENLSKKDTTDANGRYNMASLPMGKQYMIQPNLTGSDPFNGISTYALFVGQRFILGMRPAEIVSPYQVIAGDANCDGRFTTLDLFLIQRLIIGTSEDFGSCPSWVFVKANEQMPAEFNTTNVFPYHNCDTMMLMKDTVSNFIGVKVGDILGHANPRLLEIEPRSLGTLQLIAQNRKYRAGDVVEITLTSENFHQIASYQMGLSFDFNQLEFLELTTDAQTPFSRIALNAKRAAEGTLRLSWFDGSGKGVSAKSEAQLLTLRFRALQDIEDLANLLQVNDRQMPSEAYTVGFEKMDIALQFTNQPVLESNEQVTVDYKLYQNVPNPFKNQTIIGFDLPMDMQADLIVFDQLGKVVKTFSGNYSKGYNQIEFPRETLSAGMYYYTLRTGNFAQTKTMIIFE